MKAMMTQSSQPQHPGVPVAYYKEAMEQCHSFNSRLMAERRVRLPYLDSQTGVAQNNCTLLFERWQRGPGLRDNQIYSYPDKRWKKKPRSGALLDTPFGHTQTNKTISNTTTHSENHHQPLLNENSNSSSSQPVDYDVIGDYGEDLADDDDDYYDEDSRRRKGKRSRGRGMRGGLRRMDRDDERDKPFQCAYCGKRYKNKPGLNYHIQRYHQDEDDGDEDYNPRATVSTPSLIDQDSNPSNSQRTGAMTPRSSGMPDDVSEDVDDERPTRGRRKKQTVNSAYCDFCLGDAEENKKTGEPEELVSCADCGRSGHPSCLQFTDIMTMNVKKYKWQCIECKSCHLCSTSDNDDQLLFCDDCDRGYHMYCLSPPMDEPPEGNWICSLCEVDRKEREASK